MSAEKGERKSQRNDLDWGAYMEKLNQLPLSYKHK